MNTPKSDIPCDFVVVERFSNGEIGSVYHHNPADHEGDRHPDQHRAWPIGPDGLTSVERELADAKARIEEAVNSLGCRILDCSPESDFLHEVIDKLQPRKEVPRET